MLKLKAYVKDCRSSVDFVIRFVFVAMVFPMVNGVCVART